MRNTTILRKYVVHANALTYFTFAVTYLGMATSGGRNLAFVRGLLETFKMDLVMVYNSQFHFLNLYLETKITVKDS